MKEQVTEGRGQDIQESIGQRPIHTTYEPPGPLPQFRPRPKLSRAPVQPEPPRRPPVSATIRKRQPPASETAAASAEAAAAKKKG